MLQGYLIQSFKQFYFYKLLALTLSVVYLSYFELLFFSGFFFFFLEEGEIKALTLTELTIFAEL